ncbi:MAG: purine-nucleoside phosphorylase [Anaerolineae bacterium]|nr:purine-nucleoside phosphorylase [Anaerolineae bacterium]
MPQQPPRSLYQSIAAYIRGQIEERPDVGIILGSGLGVVASRVEEAVVFPYETLPFWPRSGVEGHQGELVIGRWAGHVVAVMRGRAHYYEGHSMIDLALPVRVLHALGIKQLVVTNAAGGLDPAFHAGDLMLITDHINLVGMAGLSPLRGPNDPVLGPRFPDMRQAYDATLAGLARSVAREKLITLREGVYVMVAGPVFETPADIRFLRLIGADAVGMSTVPEVVTARHLDLPVLGLSGITNVAPLSPDDDPTTHEEVLATAQVIGPRMRTLIEGVLERL